ncbi:MAG: GNAT family N-acetyltransferase [Bacteroidetes bacterium]|nr:GNAT family N-acetyltransferase [Bacteroidota bacterium]
MFEHEKEAKPLPGYLSSLLQKKDMLFMAAILNNQTLAGGLTFHLLSSVYSEKPEVYIYDFGINPNYQRMGIGTKLLNDLKEYCIEKNYGTIFVQAEAVDEHALNFYRKNRGDENAVRHFSFKLSFQKK